MHRQPLFEELDYRKTPLGDLSLRRRTMLSLDDLDVFEVVLGDAFLMSSMFTVVEEALANLGIAAAAKTFAETPLDVVVGGLGLGHTAQATLAHSSVQSLNVIEFLRPVIEWHESGLVPLGKELTDNPRCRFVEGDFFQLALTDDTVPSFDPESAQSRFHAILLDIDHSPANLLHARHAAFYHSDGLRTMAAKLLSGGVFGLWSDDPPDDDFMKALDTVFTSCESHLVPFHNPLQDRTCESTVYLATKA